MPDIVVKAKVKADHSMTAQVPEEVSAGEYDVVVKVPEETSIARLKAVLTRISEDFKTGKRPGRTKEEIDAQLKKDRDEWDERIDRLRD